MERMEPLWQKSAEVCLCVYLICCGLQLAGCKETPGVISCSPGESVLLTCVNSPSQYKDIQWWFSRPGALSPEYCVFPLNCRKNQSYTNRFHLHENLSLSITGLTEKDSGAYWCRNTATDTNKYISLTVEGCSISENEESVKISKYSGEFVLMNCSVRCTDHRNPDQWGWKLPNNREITSTKPNHLHQGRVQMFDINSGNLSLLISNLTEKDEGLYSCWINKNQHKNFSLTVKGCTLSKNERNYEMKYPGDSVLLSCSCKDSKARPENFTWVHLDSGTVVSNDTSRYKGRVHMFHKSTPSNLSLLIFNLTEEDQGIYRCSINNNISTHTNLTVKGCLLSESNEMRNSHTGESVLLTCVCKDDKTRAQHFEWRRADLNQIIVSDTENSKGRFRTHVKDSPSDLSLLISNLTEADQGVYVCTVNGKQSRVINVTVTTVTASGGFIMNTLIGLMLLVLMLGMTACICWRCMRAKKNKHGKSRRPDDEGDVTYTTVVHLEGRKPDRNQQENGVTYNVVALNETVQPTKSEDDVTYSAIVHSKSHTDQALR